MLKLSDFAGRLLRTDTPGTLGKPSHLLAKEAIDAGRLEEAKQLTRTAHDEFKSLHDLYCDWMWDMLSNIAKRFGEAEIYTMLRATQDKWMLRRTWKAFRNMAIKTQVDLTAEMMRAHRCGPEQDGEISVTRTKRNSPSLWIRAVAAGACGAAIPRMARRRASAHRMILASPKKRIPGRGDAKMCLITAPIAP